MGQTRRDNLKLLGGALAGVFGLAGWGVSGCAPALWERLGVSKEQFSRLEQAAAKIDPFTFPSDEEVRDILPIIYESVTGTPFSTYVHGIQFKFLYDTPVSGFFNHSNRIVTYAKTPDHMKHRFATMPSYALRRIVALYWDTIFHELGHANEPETLTSFPSHAELSDYCEVKTNSDKQILNHVLSFVTGLSPDQREYHNRVKQV
ncbi:hypothetical protein J4410_02115, partial [Candidatus Woesearchaeota archaeon]|nr:hypothetical protein [Candidatus Woesearchaeota archaeon]